MEQRTGGHCLNCDRSEEQLPLLSVRFRGDALWVCPQCLPILIHHPEDLADKLGGPPLTGAPHEH